MRFIYDRKDETVIEYNPIDRIRFAANDPKVLRKPNKPTREKVTTFHFSGSGTVSNVTVKYRDATDRY